MRRLALEWTVGKPFGRAPTACGQGGQGEMGEQNRGGVYEGGWKGGTGGAFQYDDDSTLNSSSAFLVPRIRNITRGTILHKRIYYDSFL